MAGGEIEVRERPIIFSAPMVRAIMRETDPKTQTRRPVTKPTVLEWLNQFLPEFVAAPENHLSPYGHAGDRLWVRETFMRETEDGTPTGGFIYRASDRPEPDGEKPLRWTPAIHMPRTACRLRLDVAAVRIERLLDISVDDAFDEGIEAKRCPDCHLAAFGLPEWGHDADADRRQAALPETVQA